MTKNNGLNHMQKKASKILIIIFLLIFILQLASLVFLLLTPQETKAAWIESGAKTQFEPQVDIPGLNKAEVQPDGTTRAIGNYIIAVYRYAIGVVGILAAVVMMWGGVLWLMSGGSSERVSNAKSWIMASLSGLVLALASYMILAMVNPDLVNFKVKNLTQIESTENCCSSKRGSFPGFLKTTNNKQEYSCTPVPANEQQIYGNVQEYNPNTQSCKDQGNGSYIIENFGCCYCTNCPDTFSYIKCHSTTEKECEAMKKAAPQVGWNFTTAGCDTINCN